MTSQKTGGQEVMEITITADDFERMFQDVYYKHPDNNQTWKSFVGEMEVYDDATGDAHKPGLNWKYGYLIYGEWATVVLLREFLKSKEYRYEVAYSDGERDADGKLTSMPHIVLFTDYASPSVVQRDEVHAAVWRAWHELKENEPSPAKRIAHRLGLGAEQVAEVVFPIDRFGQWDASDEPDI
jgi:hypothetical protein